MVVRVIIRGDRDSNMHHDPCDAGVEKSYKCRFIPTTTKIWPKRGKDNAPRKRKGKVDSGAQHVRPPAYCYLEFLSEHQARRIRRNAGERHQMLSPNPN